MSKLYQLSSQERQDFFDAASEKMNGVTSNIIEKDYWVVWVLGQLFSTPKLNQSLTFKGGTSLSKVYRVIQRFSEDIDVSIERSFLGLSDEKSPERAGSKKKQQSILDDLSELCSDYIQGPLFKTLYESFEEALGTREPWTLKVDPNDSQTLLFEYPTTLLRSNYVLPSVKIEMGARSEHWPVSEHVIYSYVKEHLGEKVEEDGIKIKALNAERTFWEKATILHQYAHLPESKPLPPRISRHYYDFFCLLQSDIKRKALEKEDLLPKVVAHKKVYFASAWASYDTATKGSLKLIPNQKILKVLENDYSAMNEMFFGRSPDWEEITDTILIFEKELNRDL